MKIQIANKIGKSPSFITQYFKGLKKMSWKTAKKANMAYPEVEIELWMDQNLNKIEQILSVKNESKKVKAKQLCSKEIA